MTDSDSDPVDLPVPLGVDNALWCALLGDRERPKQIPYATWYAWKAGVRTPALTRIREYLRYLAIPEATALRHLGWGNLQGVESFEAVQRWIKQAVCDRARARNGVREAERLRAGGLPHNRGTVAVQKHRARLDYVKYLASIGCDCPRDARGFPIPLREIGVPAGFIRNGPRVRPDEPPPIDLSKIEGAPQ